MRCKRKTPEFLIIFNICSLTFSTNFLSPAPKNSSNTKISGLKLNKTDEINLIIIPEE